MTDDNRLSELRIVVSYLHKEKGIVDLQMEMAERENAKWQETGLSLSQAISSKKIRPSPIKRPFSMPNPITTSCAGIDTSSLNAFYNHTLSRSGNGIF